MKARRWKRYQCVVELLAGQFGEEFERYLDRNLQSGYIEDFDIEFLARHKMGVEERDWILQVHSQQIEKHEKGRRH
jgi:hypothetical protein